MKMLVHRIAGGAALPFDLADLMMHLRVSDDAELAAIQNIGCAVAAEIEQAAQIALLTQTVRVTILDPSHECGLSLPIGPDADAVVPIVAVDGAAFAGFDFVSGNRPYIRWHPTFHDLSPSRVEVEYQAGFGASATDIPPDLRQALMDQAALHYDGRSPMDGRALTSSPHMARIAARYRGVAL